MDQSLPCPPDLAPSIIEDLDRHAVNGTSRQQGSPWDEVLATVAHDLRAPLAAIIGLAGTIAKGAERLSPERIRELAEAARVEGWRLDRLVEDLLQASSPGRRLVQVTPQLLDAADVVRSSVAALRIVATDHDLTLDVPASGPWLWADPDVVTRILANLVGNAIKYTPPRTRIAVRLVEVQGAVILKVADDGPGMSPAECERAFEKFHRGADTAGRSGLGLGLYLVRALAEAHGGSARLHPMTGGGLEAEVRLADLTPAAPPPSRGRSGRLIHRS